jgi:putative endopeptidase
MTYLKRCAPLPPVAAGVLALVVAMTPACRTTNSTTSGIDLAGMDKAVAPGEDFNAYVSGGWIKATPIPADKSSYGPDAILDDETRKRLLALIEE